MIYALALLFAVLTHVGLAYALSTIARIRGGAPKAVFIGYIVMVPAFQWLVMWLFILNHWFT